MASLTLSKMRLGFEYYMGIGDDGEGKYRKVSYPVFHEDTDVIYEISEALMGLCKWNIYNHTLTEEKRYSINYGDSNSSTVGGQ